jgi:predicted metal-dependent hydrolase
MARRPRKVHEEQEIWEVGDLRIPVRIITERGRYGTRASVTSRALIIRVPALLPPGERSGQIRKMLNWARGILREKPAAFAHFRATELVENYRFTLRDRTYRIQLETHVARSHRIKALGEEELLVKVNANDDRLHHGQLLPRLLAKHFGKQYLPVVRERVHELNQAHFRRPIHSVKLSDTYSRWGSCSAKGNINLATRLLLAPEEVLDAVIIHELAHLVEQNHSARFWAEVSRALPNYREYDVWLREHGKELVFRPEPV